MTDSSTSQHADRFAVSLANDQALHTVNEPQLLDGVRAVLRQAPLNSATISVAVVDDRTIHELNRRYLGHDWPTDVLSFLLEERDDHLEGEVIISADTAAATAAEVGWSPAAEQLLYVIHGTLHLIGFEDKTPVDADRMRAAEAEFLKQFGFTLSPDSAGMGKSLGEGANLLPEGAAAP
jgi:probable rRNA maturation factor